MSFADYYNDTKRDINNMSYWYPKIKDCGIATPKTLIVPVPQKIVEAFFMEQGRTDQNMVAEWVEKVLYPKMKENGLTGLVFMKNGTFSNKFDFSTCNVVGNNITRIALSLIDINYESFILGAGGNTEVVIRERIPYNKVKTPCIYHGMPLRNEYRLFYDFDNHKPLYIDNPELIKEREDK